MRRYLHAAAEHGPVEPAAALHAVGLHPGGALRSAGRNRAGTRRARLRRMDRTVVRGARPGPPMVALERTTRNEPPAGRRKHAVAPEARGRPSGTAAQRSW